MSSRNSLLRRAAPGVLAATLLVCSLGLTAATAAAAPSVGIAEQADLCAQVGRSAGFEGGHLVIAVAVALAESRCIPSALLVNGPTSGCPNGSRDRGLWQVNDCYHPNVTDACAFNAQCNANAAFQISSGGANWQPWTAYKNGAYTSWLDEAEAAVARLAPPKTHLMWMQRDSLSGGNASRAFVYGVVGDLPLVGDWDGNGTETPGLWRPSTAEFLLKNSNTGGNADKTFRFGAPGVGHWPIVGDWDGNGTDNVGVFDLNTARWYLDNGNNGGTADVTFVYGTQGDLPIPGDWNNDGKATAGVLRGGNRWLLRNSNSGGAAELNVSYGTSGDVPVVGDWNDIGGETPGVVRGANWLLRNDFVGGNAQISFIYGTPGDTFTPGDWNGDGQPAAGIVRAI